MFKGCVVWYLVAAMFIIGVAPRVEAAFSPSEAVGVSPMGRAGDMETIRVALEHKVVAQRLHDLGYAPQEIMTRLSDLSDSQIHSFAQRLDEAKVGGDGGLGFVIAILLVIVLVLLILHLTGHKVAVK
ncbi:MAG: PA2779 family protein [Syntrophorhabdales bacterium]|jgi:hypothetical protein